MMGYKIAKASDLQEIARRLTQPQIAQLISQTRNEINHLKLEHADLRRMIESYANRMQNITDRLTARQKEILQYISKLENDR